MKYLSTFNIFKGHFSRDVTLRKKLSQSISKLNNILLLVITLQNTDVYNR